MRPVYYDDFKIYSTLSLSVYMSLFFYGLYNSQLLGILAENAVKEG